MNSFPKREDALRGDEPESWEKISLLTDAPHEEIHSIGAKTRRSMISPRHLCSHRFVLDKDNQATNSRILPDEHSICGVTGRLFATPSTSTGESGSVMERWYKLESIVPLLKLLPALEVEDGFYVG